MLRSLTNLLLVTLALLNSVLAGFDPVTSARGLPYAPQATYIISGRISNVGDNSPLKDVTVTGGDAITTTDEFGYYEVSVSSPGSYALTPSLAGFSFYPDHRDYTDIPSDQPAQDYTATPVTYTISGNAGTGGATLSYTDGSDKTETADADGNYDFTVSYNWSGTVTPSKPGFTFEPPERSYTAILADQPTEDYIATPISYTISGNAGAEGVTLKYTDGTDQTATADANGNYAFTVSYNWSGTVTPAFNGLYFTPEHRHYSDVLVDQADQNFIITHYYAYFPAVMHDIPDPTVFYDNFDSGDRGWQPKITPGGEAGISNGTYRLYHSSTNQFLAALAPISASQIPAAGYVVEANFTLVQGSSNRIGLVFDWQSSNSFQLLQIRPTTQQYWIYKWNGTYQLVTNGYSAAINPALGSANVIRLVRSSSSVQLFINNTTVTGQIPDAKANNVLVGLQLSVYSSSPGEGHFDDFKISKLP